VVPAALNSGGSLSVHEVLRRWAPAYLAQFRAAMPTRQREVLQTILACRTPALGGALHYCPECRHRHFTYHSCNDRHCPQCGGQDAQQWLAANTALLLPAPYFLVTFTVPEGLRRWIRSHPSLGYDLLLAASAQALQDLAQNPKRLGATLGLLAVLHTWTDTQDEGWYRVAFDDLKLPYAYISTQTVAAAADALNQHKVGSVLVMEGGKLLGIFTERDILRRVVGERRDPANTKVGDVMTKDLVVMRPSASVVDAMRVISEKRIRHIPVVEGGAVVGVVSQGDLNHWLVRNREGHIQDLVDFVTGKYPA